MTRTPSFSKPGSSAAIAELAIAAHDPARVSGLTHNFYRYPARFSPTFVRGAIRAYSKPGDWVLDPFAGGGTTLVEALASGRNAIGTDISSLSHFICEAKTTLLDDQEIAAVRRWVSRVPEIVNIHGDSLPSAKYEEAGYYRNLGGVWRLRKAIDQLLSSVERLRCGNAEVLARCIVLRTSQWALDARKTIPTVTDFRNEVQRQGSVMITASKNFRNMVASHAPIKPCVHAINRSATGLETEKVFEQMGAPKLIVTSPPYPGIHVLYHRWQVDGRKEAPAPFWIANKMDGAGSAYYTLGDRKNPKLQSYFDNLREAFTSIGKVCGSKTTVVQMVAFSDAKSQLPHYLEVMRDCGLTEVLPWDEDNNARDGRLWRDVPNRRWHAQQKQLSPGAREVVLVHKKTAKC
jgi:DNA modification methylase